MYVLHQKLAAKLHVFVSVGQVVGVEDLRMGEEVCACIKLVDGQDCTPEEIKAYCKGKVRHSSPFNISE